jgi:hypothetical protein
MEVIIIKQKLIKCRSGRRITAGSAGKRIRSTQLVRTASSSYKLGTNSSNEHSLAIKALELNQLVWPEEKDQH